jgi:hypothetical protein
MQIPALAGQALGLTGTAAAIRKGQERFDERAGAVVADAAALAGDEPGDTGQLAADVVGMQADAVANQVLYGVFRRQRDNEQALLDAVKPRG